MPRGSGGSSAGGQASLRGAEQSLHIMRQVKSYFNVGMDHVLEVATDMAENGAGKGTSAGFFFFFFFKCNRSQKVLQCSTKMFYKMFLKYNRIVQQKCFTKCF